MERGKEAGGGANDKPADDSGVAAWLGPAWHDTW